MYQALKSKKKTIAVVGLGYVGLPIALVFARHFRVIGFDINKSRLDIRPRREDCRRDPTEKPVCNTYTHCIMIIFKNHLAIDYMLNQ